MSFGAITSVGTLLTAIALFTPEATAAALYYTVHSTLAAAALFLVADMVRERQGGEIAPKPVMAQSGLISVLFFVAAIATAGMPPLSGFLGKLLILDAARDSTLVVWVWAVILISSLITIMGFARAGTLIFWKSHGLTQDHSLEEPEIELEQADQADAPSTPRAPALPFVACFSLLAGLAALTLFAGPVTRYTTATAADLFAPQAYIETVLANRDRTVVEPDQTPGDKTLDLDAGDTTSEENH